MKYILRTYRDKFSKDRFESFDVVVKDSDIWVGVDKESYSGLMKNFCTQQIFFLRNLLEDYIVKNQQFKMSLTPIEMEEGMPFVAKEMIKYSSKVGVGPMATVAGYFADYIGNKIIQEFNIKEIVLENGGDIFVFLKKSMIVSIFAGDSVLSEKVGVVIPEGSFGICTSSGTVGHSYSEGIADAVMVVCENPSLADAYATFLANKIKSKDNVVDAINIAKSKKEILSCVIICQDNIGICGNFEILNLGY